MDANIRHCKCKAVSNWASEHNTPIVFDERMNEYHFVFGGNQSDFLVIYYCFFCGGKLPESKRDEFVVETDQQEVEDITRRMLQVTSVLSMQEALGKADRVYQAEGGSDYVADHMYDVAYKTIDLGIREFSDGHIEYYIRPKYKGDR